MARSKKGKVPSQLAPYVKKASKTVAVPRDHVPAHTFASSTMPRSSRMMPTRTNPDPDKDGDNDLSASGDKDHDYVLPDGSPGPKARKQASTPLRPTVLTRTREMAAPQKPLPKQIIKPSRAGLFTAKAKAAGMSVQAYAAKVLANKGQYDTATVRQASFAHGFARAAAKTNRKSSS